MVKPNSTRSIAVKNTLLNVSTIAYTCSAVDIVLYLLLCVVQLTVMDLFAFWLIYTAMYEGMKAMGGACKYAWILIVIEIDFCMHSLF